MSTDEESSEALIPPNKDLGSLSNTDIFEILSNERRQHVLRYLFDNAPDDSVLMHEIVNYTAEKENDTPIDELESEKRKCVYTALRQSHLPKLASYGIINYDQQRGEVELVDGLEEVQEYLTYDPDGSGQEPSRTPGGDDDAGSRLPSPIDEQEDADESDSLADDGSEPPPDSHDEDVNDADTGGKSERRRDDDASETDADTRAESARGDGGHYPLVREHPDTSHDGPLIDQSPHLTQYSGLKYLGYGVFLAGVAYAFQVIHELLRDDDDSP